MARPGSTRRESAHAVTPITRSGQRSQLRTRPRGRDNVLVLPRVIPLPRTRAAEVTEPDFDPDAA